MKEISQLAEPILSDQYPGRVGHRQRPGVHPLNFAGFLGHACANVATFKASADSNGISKISMCEHLANKTSNLSLAKIILIKQYPAIEHEIRCPLRLKMCVRETFDALAEDRPCHRGLSNSDNLKILQRKQRLFDPELLNKLVAKVQRPEYAEPSAGEN